MPRASRFVPPQNWDWETGLPRVQSRRRNPPPPERPRRSLANPVSTPRPSPSQFNIVNRPLVTEEPQHRPEVSSGIDRHDDAARNREFARQHFENPGATTMVLPLPPPYSEIPPHDEPTRSTMPPQKPKCANNVGDWERPPPSSSFWERHNPKTAEDHGEAYHTLPADSDFWKPHTTPVAEDSGERLLYPDLEDGFWNPVVPTTTPGSTVDVVRQEVRDSPLDRPQSDGRVNLHLTIEGNNNTVHIHPPVTGTANRTTNGTTTQCTTQPSTENGDGEWELPEDLYHTLGGLNLGGPSQPSDTGNGRISEWVDQVPVGRAPSIQRPSSPTGSFSTAATERAELGASTICPPPSRAPPSYRSSWSGPHGKDSMRGN